MTDRAPQDGDPATDWQHRTRNVLAVMRSVFERTVEDGTSLEEVASHYQGRFDTLTPYLIGGGMDEDGFYDLETLVWNEVLRFPAEDEDVFTVGGPAVRLPHAMAQPLALALHELATNAVKFGALGGARGGRIAVSWARDGDDLVVEWRETGVAIVRSTPLRQGFGRKFIEQGLPYQIGAATTFELAPGAVTSTVRLPTDRIRISEG